MKVIIGPKHLYITFDVKRDINNDLIEADVIMSGCDSHSSRCWVRHTAVVPKAVLRCQVLELPNEKPFSGSEIMDDIEKRTDGCWKPSPGSVYPLLTWLQDDGYIKEVPSEENGMKRYTLTDKDRTFLKEQKKIKAQISREGRFFAPPFFGAPWFHIPPEKAAELRESARRFMAAFFDFRSNLREDLSEQAINEALKLLSETTAKLEEINKKSKEKRANKNR